MRILQSLESLKGKIMRKLFTIALMGTGEPIQPFHIRVKEIESHTGCDMLGFSS